MVRFLVAVKFVEICLSTGIVYIVVELVYDLFMI